MGVLGGTNDNIKVCRVLFWQDTFFKKKWIFYCDITEISVFQTEEGKVMLIWNNLIEFRIVN